ncbi:MULTISPECIES: DEAD/DEAH box helicase [unclassified Bacillus (in: firmicutes)]|uniref:DEAD/DEAH box helicase n=1 Tax=unclassified Bacillus (in: firmicutes) TaxID=185979 RepID=UPI0008EF2D09|nr:MULTISPECIES: DEAD/DEAH box helicase [unclassified Bacillus (in: firmicutes)]SFJ68755.1 Superfamily II DNA or RNA helicase, SNF2 family [Bacillus sp. 71mf]SFT20728.1 Superfamily II DNA or RNA helicase, SNF2 family [Bacillus sp. 103mf]
MTTQIDITIRLERMKQNWFLWAEDETGNSLPLINWKQHAFTWHSSSFYGTLLQEGTYEQRSGIILNATQAFEYIAKKPVNSFTKLQTSAAISELAPLAEKMWEAYTTGDFLPDIKQWHQYPSWKIAHEEVIDETMQTLFSEAINETLRHHTRSEKAWESAKRLYEHYDFTKRQIEAAIHENDWLRKIGYLEDDLPFTVGLRLQEPENDFETWQLETILTPKRGTHRIYVYTEDRSLPKRWLNHEARITETQEGFGKLVPWLMEDGIFRGELYETEAWRFLTEASNELLAAGVDILLPSWWQNLKANKPKLRVQVKHNAKAGQAFFGMNTLVDFDWRISTNGIDLSEAEFLALIEQNRRLIHINGQWMRLDPAFIEEVKKLMKKADKYGLEMKDVVQQRLLRGAETEVVEEENPFADMEIELDDYYDKLFERLLHIGEIPSIKVPTSLQATLRPYQQQGVEWLLYLRELGFGALLADDMGLGKSIQTITYLLYIKEHNLKTGPALIVAPTSVLGNWQKEFERFAPSLRVKLHYGGNRTKGEDLSNFVQDADVILTSYALTQLDEEELSSQRWDAIILDEAQNIKNPHTKQSRAVRKLQANHKITLTGTPMENRLSELWSIFDFLNHGYLGSLLQFQRRFVTPIEKDRDETKIQQVQRLIAPFLLRRTKQDKSVALNLPDKQEQKAYCSLTAEQASLYEQLVQDTLKNVEGLTGIERRGFILLMLNKLKQICNHPALYLKEELPANLIKRSMKIETLLELVENIRDQHESCLIFTQYIRMGNMLQTLLEEHFGERVIFLNGSVPKKERDKMIEQFQNGQHGIFLLSLKAGGTGLNLTAANHVIHYDRWWNPAVENQATDRAYRIGQKRFVHVHKLITTGTLEEKIDEMLERKQSLNNAIITSENWITELSTNELKELLGV